MLQKRGRLRTLRLRAALATGDFRKLLGGHETPSLPDVVLRLIPLCEDPSSDARSVAEAIALDPGLSAWILRLANSAAFGRAVHIADVRRAVVVLGMRRVRDYSLGRSVISVVADGEIEGFDVKRFWTESLFRGIVSGEIARRVIPGAEGEAFTGGLLQDMAVPVLLSRCPEPYRATTVDATGPELAARELEAFGWTHAQAGAWLARDWRFPDELVCAIGMHHEGGAALAERGFMDTPVGVVSASAVLQPSTGSVSDHLEGFAEELRQRYEIVGGAAEEILTRSVEQFRGACELFELPVPESLALSDPE